MSRVLRSPV